MDRSYFLRLIFADPNIDFLLRLNLDSLEVSFLSYK